MDLSDAIFNYLQKKKNEEEEEEGGNHTPFDSLRRLQSFFFR
jgi:hypothetical protein